MDSFLLAGLSRLLRALAIFCNRSERLTSPKPRLAPKTYEDLLSEALSESHPLHIRHQLPTRCLTSLLTAESQLVNLSPGSIPSPTHVPAYVVDDLTRPPKVALSISAALNGCVWDSRLVQTGFDWTARSIWFIPLDVSLLAHNLLDRHLRMVATLSTPDSCGVVLYPARDVKVSGFTLESPFEDVVSFMKHCGFTVDSVTTLAELSGELVPEYDDYMNAMQVAVVRPAPRAPSPVIDTFSEITYTSNDMLSRATSAEFEEYISSDRRIVRFELDISTLPAHLATEENQVVVMGSESCVGCWDPRHAKRMTGRIDIASVLVADVPVNVFAGDMEYKYAIVRGDDVVEWEIGWNRCLKDNGEIVQDKWRCS